MKTNKYSDLLRFGLTQKTLMTLSESEINILHKNLIERADTKTAPKTKPGTKTPPKTRPHHPGKNPSPDVKPDPKAGKKETKEQTNQNVSKKTVSNTEYTIGQGGELAVGDAMIQNVGGQTKVVMKSGREKELGESKKKGKKKEYKVNPWAVCHKQLGPKKTAKFESCVKQVKKSIEEGKDPFSVLLENKILSLVERYVKPKMKKGELMDLIGKKKMNLPIGKLGSISVANEDTKTAPKTKPGTKTPPKTRPHHPGKNPSPNVKPDPKAQSPEKVKTDMITSIMNIIKKG